MNLGTRMVVAGGLLLSLLPEVSADLGPPLIDAFWRPWNLGMLVMNFLLNVLVYAFLYERIEDTFIRVNRRFLTVIAVFTIVGFVLDSLFIIVGHEVSAGGFRVGDFGRVIDEPRLIALTGAFIAVLAMANYGILSRGLRLPKNSAVKIAAVMALILNPPMYYLMSSITYVMAFIVYVFRPIISLVILFLLVVVFIVLQGTGKARKLPRQRIHLYRFLALLLAISFVIAAMVGYGYGGWRPGMTTTMGFSRLKPQLAWFHTFENGSVQLPMSNGAGTEIQVVSATASELESDGTCLLTLKEKTASTPIGPNETLWLHGVDCHNLGQEDLFHLNITIHYTLTYQGIPSNHTESGTIRGVVE